MAALEGAPPAVSELYFPQRLLLRRLAIRREIDVLRPLGQDAVRKALPRDARDPPGVRVREEILCCAALEEIQRELER